MIIELLLDVVYALIYALTLPINIPGLPSEVHTYIDTLIQYIGTGIGILSNYCHLSYLLVLFGIVIAVDVGIWLYKIVMFFIRKIPMANIS